MSAVKTKIMAIAVALGLALGLGMGSVTVSAEDLKGLRMRVWHMHRPVPYSISLS